MPRKRYIPVLLCLGIIACGAAFWMLGNDGPPVTDDDGAKPDRVATGPAGGHANQAPATDAPAMITAHREGGSGATVTEELAEELPAYEDNPLAERELLLRLSEVSDQYAEAIHYPVTSEPIHDAAALQKYLPNQSVSSAMPLDPSRPDGTRMLLQTDRYRYDSGQDVVATVILDALPAGAEVRVAGRLLRQGQLVAETAGITLEGGAAFGLLFAAETLAGQPGGELRVVAEVGLDGRRHELGAPIEYGVGGGSSVVGPGDAAVDGEYLVIPVQIVTSRPGYHELSGNLYSANTGRPLVHLSTQEDVVAQSGILTLRAHIQALKVHADHGPYVLKDLQLFRMPSAPDFSIVHGSEHGQAHPISGFSFDQYDDLPYVDAEAEERLSFLRGLTDAP